MSDDIAYLTDILHKIEISSIDASSIVLPVTKRGRRPNNNPPSNNKRSSGMCKGTKGIPCKDNLQYTDQTKHLFLSNSMSRCKKCHAAYYRKYYQENRERCTEIGRETTRRQRVREALIAKGAVLENV